MMIVLNVTGRTVCSASVFTSYVAYDVLWHGRAASSCTQLAPNL